jgi:hypothetical protein
MKVKEQNVRLNLIVFLQLAMIGSIGAGVSEGFKIDRNNEVTALCLGFGFIVSMITMYLYYRVLKRSKK